MYILTVQGDLTKFVSAIPIPSHPNPNARRGDSGARVRAKRSAKVWDSRSNLDRSGGENLSEQFANVCKLLQIKKIQTTAFHPESNGSLERGHKVLVEHLRHYIAEGQRDWDEWIAYATYVYNITTHRVTGYSPFELLFGYRARIPTAMQVQPTPRCNYDDYVSELKGRLQSAQAIARKNLLQSKARSKLS